MTDDEYSTIGRGSFSKFQTRKTRPVNRQNFINIFSIYEKYIFKKLSQVAFSIS